MTTPANPNPPAHLDLPAMEAARWKRAEACMEALRHELGRMNDWLRDSKLPPESLVYQQHLDAATALSDLIMITGFLERQSVIKELKVIVRPDFKLWGRSEFLITGKFRDGWLTAGYDGQLLPGEAAWAMYMAMRAINGVTGNEATAMLPAQDVTELSW